MNKYNHIFAEIMMASWLYYHKDKTVMSDIEYDEKYKLCKANWKQITHKYKKLVKIRSDYTSMFYIREQDYPQGLKRIALLWENLLNVNKERTL